jgi:hypothetical protein
MLAKKIVLIILSCTLILLLGNCHKQENVYEIKGYFEAYFPSQPTLHKRVPGNISSATIYSYYDEIDHILYLASYSILHYPIVNRKGTLHSYVLGLNESGEILKKEFGEHDGNDEILYVMRYERGHQFCYDFGIAAIKDSIIYLWVVEEKQDMVKADSIYGEYVKYFKVLN